MELDLVHLLSLSGHPDVATDSARFYCHVPDVAPYAYLHTIYAPADSEILGTSSVHIPKAWCSFLKIQNGADLFSNALFIYGMRRKGHMHDRSSNYSTSAFSLEEANAHPVLRKFPMDIQVGNYGYNGARVLLSRDDLSIKVVSRSGEREILKWKSIEVFLRSEISRLASLFSGSGKLLVNEELTLPSLGEARN